MCAVATAYPCRPPPGVTRVQACQLAGDACIPGVGSKAIRLGFAQAPVLPRPAAVPQTRVHEGVLSIHHSSAAASAILYADDHGTTAPGACGVKSEIPSPADQAPRLVIELTTDV